MQPLIPAWVYETAEIIATLATLIAAATYGILFNWASSRVGRHRFAMYAVLSLTLIASSAAMFTGFYVGEWLLATVLFLAITGVMIWSEWIMLQAPPPARKAKEVEVDESDSTDHTPRV